MRMREKWLVDMSIMDTQKKIKRKKIKENQRLSQISARK